ncbi:hypothetical protein BPAE_0168g00120 [Botrytis paeoniae]|uniref:Fungal N-terminal domain-containing protein n=1 Tax=Botrytis paeoniae TaxID=278948 RepID=A0A4Z1FLP2_9HELO|nr:hypothetical protein BPAE_0168g00120 [Botrytis paeoniae]
MDPVSVIGLTGSLLSIGKIITKSIRSLTTLQSKYKDASLMVSLLIGQLTTIRAALSEVSDWITTSLRGIVEHEQLVDDLKVSLGSILMLISILDDRISQLDRNDLGDLNLRGKIKFLWDENEMGELDSYLNSQINALTLLLSSIQWYVPAMYHRRTVRSTFDRNQFLRRSDSRHTFQKVEDGRSSLMMLGSRSVTTDSMSLLDIEFDFDHEIITTDVYRNALRSLRKITNKKPQANTINVIEETPNPEMDGNTVCQNTSQSDANQMGSKVSTPNKATAFIQKSIPLPLIPETTVLKDITLETSVSINFTNYKSNSTSRSTPSLAGNASKSSKFYDPILRHMKLPAPAMQNLFGNNVKPTLRPPHITPLQDNMKIPSLSSVLLFGSSNSGKSTLKKSIDMFYYRITRRERFAYRESIYLNIVDCIQAVLAEMKERKIPSAWAQKHGLYDTGDWPYEYTFGIICSFGDSLWEDSGFQDTFRRTGDLALKESRIFDPGYLPNHEDVLRLLVRSTGIDTTFITCNSKSVKVYDVGGSRSERKKWIHTSGNGQAIIVFTVSMSTFERPAFEDLKGFCLLEDGLVLFKSMVTTGTWGRPKFILLFTKIDEFMRNIGTVPFQKAFKEHFPRFEGDIGDIQNIKDCFRQRFMDVVEEKFHKDVVVLFGNLVDPTLETTKVVLATISNLDNVLG